MSEQEMVLLQQFIETGDAEAFSETTRRYAGLVYGTCPDSSAGRIRDQLLLAAKRP